jgi:RND family efflux transporter MFP subunit
MNANGGYERSLEGTKARKGLPVWLTAVLSLLILGAGIGIAVVLVKTRPTPTKEKEAVIAPMVEVMPAHVGAHPIKMQVSGEVLPAKKVVVMPEVGGRIVWQSDELVPGGLIKSGKPLLRIDPRDYALALQQQQAQLSSQQLQLQIEKGRGKVAEKEWEIFQEERKKLGLPLLSDEEAQKLATRTPHLESAAVGVDAAQSNIARAQLQLSKTNLTAPFNAIVQMENVEKGQLVTPTSQLATLVGTDAFWVQVSIPIDKLDFLDLPKGDELGARARVWAETGRGRIERDGHILRLLGDLDPVGRMARLIVEIPDPFMLEKSKASADESDTSSKLPLLVGSFVRVEIEGITLKNVVKIPRSALQPNNEVFVVTADDKLSIRKIDVLWSGEDAVLARGPVRDGDRLITSALSTPVEGMLLRVVEPASPGATKPKGSAAEAEKASEAQETVQ